MTDSELLNWLDAHALEFRWAGHPELDPPDPEEMMLSTFANPTPFRASVVKAIRNRDAHLESIGALEAEELAEARQLSIDLEADAELSRRRVGLDAASLATQAASEREEERRKRGVGGGRPGPEGAK